MQNIKLKEVEYPTYDKPSKIPQISKEEYLERINKIKLYMSEKSITHIIIYADREHSANISFVCGFEPRFEEALLIISNEKDKPLLLVGNESIGYTDISPIDFDIELFQSFSLLGQDRNKSRKLSEIFTSIGINKKARVGVIGWKYFSEIEFQNYKFIYDLPHYIIENILVLIENRNKLTNETDLLMHPARGLRSKNSVDQLAFFEFSAFHTSEGMKNVLQNLKIGMTELEAAELYKMNGLPLSCHPMLSSGQKAYMGLSSPTMNKLKKGDPFTTAYGVWGALNCRAGWLVEDENDLPNNAKDYAEKFSGPYFKAISKWYEKIGIGVKGSELYNVIHENLPYEDFNINLNPGHQIHLDEWVNSPIYKDSKLEICSGMALQVDVIPSSKKGYFASNIEDGIAIADKDLQKKIENYYPDMWKRINKRKNFLKNELNINIKDEILPFSNIQGLLAPYILSPNLVFINE